MSEDHLDAFVRETEENLVELNNALVDLEEDPEDKAAMDGIFRTAHTLKGNFSAMGFQSIGDLGHAIEDLLDEIRKGHLEVSPPIMDAIFDGVDLIESALEEIEQDGEPSIETDPAIERLREVLATNGSDSADRLGGEEDVHNEADASDDATALDAEDRAAFAEVTPPVVHVSLTLKETDMAGVDGMLLLDAVMEHFTLAGSQPSPEEIQDGAFEDGFDLFLAGSAPSTVESFLAEDSNVADASVTDITEEVQPATDSGAEGDAPARATDTETEETDGVSADAEASTTGGDEIKSIRIDVEQLDQLYGLVEQLVTSRIKLRRALEESSLDAAGETLDELDKISSSLQGTVMDMRLIPLKKVVNTFPRMVRDLAREQEKDIDFAMSGTEVELDRTILDEVADPLMHILRNAVDHGIEPPDERETAGKSPTGTVRLEAHRERDYVQITVRDDGKGLDVGDIRQNALDEGVRTETEIEEMDDSDVLDLIFHPGFSTSEEVTDVSGRGVGMDVVASTVNRLDGSVSVDSTVGEGTQVELRLPVSVAIVRVLFIEVGDQEFGVPITSIDEITKDRELDTINDREAIDHDGTIYPVIDLRRVLGNGANNESTDGMLLRILEDERQVVLRCDGVNRQEEVVIKPLEGELQGVPGLGGTAVIGDGKVVPIVDVGTL